VALCFEAWYRFGDLSVRSLTWEITAERLICATRDDVGTPLIHTLPIHLAPCGVWRASLLAESGRLTIKCVVTPSVPHARPLIEQEGL